LEELQKRVHKNEKLNFEFTKSYLDEKHNSQMNVRQVQEENELLRLESDQLRKAVKNVSVKAQVDAKEIEVTCEKRSNEVLGKFRQQTQVQEENLQIIKEQYLRLQQIYLNKIKGLEEGLERANKKYKNLELHRASEIEGCKRDIDMVKRKIRIYDEYLHRVKKLIDEKPKDVIDLANSGELNDIGVGTLKRQVEELEGNLKNIGKDHIVEDEAPVREENKFQ